MMRLTSFSRAHIMDGLKWFLIIQCLAAALLLAACATRPSTTARDYYVDSRAGSDNGPGTQAAPWRSLERLAAVTFHPGDTVQFARGSEFAGGFVVKQSGVKTAPILLQAYGAGAPPHFSNTNVSRLHGNAIRLDAGYIIVDGLFFSRCPDNPVAESVKKLGAVFLTTNAIHDIVRNCEMTRTPIGINVRGQSNVITGNYIHDDTEPIQPKWGPMGVMICASHNEVAHNRFVNYCAPSAEFGHDGGAIEIHDRSLEKVDIHIHHNLSLRNQGFIEFVGRVKQDHFLIDHNTCMDYQSFLGLTGPCSNFRVEYNTVVRTLAHPAPDSEDVVFWLYEEGNTNLDFNHNIFVYDPARVEPIFARGQPAHSHNLFYRTDEASLPPQANRAAYERKYLGGGASLGPGDKFGDPLFRDMTNGDFSLLPGSPALGLGAD